MLLFCAKYLSKLKQHGLPDVLSEEFLFKCLSVTIYEQFIVSIVELIMLSWQPILLYNFHNMRVTWLFYHFVKLQVHILHSLENTLIFKNIWTCQMWRHFQWNEPHITEDVRKFLKQGDSPLVIPWFNFKA